LLDAKTLFNQTGSSTQVHGMTDESRYRTEEPHEEEKERTGLLKPLPEAERSRPSGRASPVVKLLGIPMKEKNRDLLIMFLMPILVAIIDTNVYALVVIDVLGDDALYVFVLPALAAIPIGLVSSQVGRALISAFLTALFFIVFFMMFLINPGLVAPDMDVGSLFLSGMVITVMYFLFTVFASLLGCFVGILLREFF